MQTWCQGLIQKKNQKSKIKTGYSLFYPLDGDLKYKFQVTAVHSCRGVEILFKNWKPKEGINPNHFQLFSSAVLLKFKTF